MRAKPKVVLATAIVLFGVAAAFYFRRPEMPEPVETVPAAEPSPVVAKAPPAGPPQTSQLLGRIDPVDPTLAPPAPGGLLPHPNDPEMRDDSFDMPESPPWSGAASDPSSVDARMASLSSVAKNGLAPRRREHRVADGDTLSGLALRYLGRADRYYELYEANKHVLATPDVLPIGSVLTIPDVAAGPAAPLVPGEMVEIPAEKLRAAREGATDTGTPTPAGRTYRVQANDTLSAISRHFYGDANRFRDILTANADKLRVPQDLREGMVLVIP